MYGRQTEYAIAVMSRLAEVYDGGETRLPAADVADSRGLQKPFVAKILSQLSQAGLVIGSRGPGGGSALARDPKTIKLYDVFKLFERIDSDDTCPFGGGRCGVGQPCPLHDNLVAAKKAMDPRRSRSRLQHFQIER
jgi:Rrf2 family protein